MKTHRKQKVVCIYSDEMGDSYGNLLSNGGSFLGVLSKAFCALQSLLEFLQLFSGEEEVSSCCLVPLVDGCSHEFDACFYNNNSNGSHSIRAIDHAPR